MNHGGVFSGLFLLFFYTKNEIPLQLIETFLCSIMKNLYLCITFNRCPLMVDDKFLYNSVAMARYIIAYANENRYMINMTKLQKLLYITYGVYMAVKDERLINEHPQAWPYGPVFPTTRNKLLKKDFTTIKLTDADLKEIADNPDMPSLMKLVFSSYGSKTAAFLSEWSHKPGSPWDKTVNQDSFKWGDRIPDELIQSYFKSLISPKPDAGA